MTFVRKKQIPPHTGNWYLYEVESYSTPNGPRQRHIRYIGKEGTLGSTGAPGHMAGTGSVGVSTVTLPRKAKTVKLGTIESKHETPLASPVSNTNGIIVYHSKTKGDFGALSTNIGSDADIYGKGFYFATGKGYAEQYGTPDSYELNGNFSSAQEWMDALKKYEKKGIVEQRRSAREDLQSKGYQGVRGAGAKGIGVVWDDTAIKPITPVVSPASTTHEKTGGIPVFTDKDLVNDPRGDKIASKIASTFNARETPAKAPQKETDAEHAESLIKQGKHKLELAQNHKDTETFTGYTAAGRKLNKDGDWLIQQGMVLQKKIQAETEKARLGKAGQKELGTTTNEFNVVEHKEGDVIHVLEVDKRDRPGLLKSIKSSFSDRQYEYLVNDDGSLDVYNAVTGRLMGIIDAEGKPDNPKLQAFADKVNLRVLQAQGQIEADLLHSYPNKGNNPEVIKALENITVIPADNPNQLVIRRIKLLGTIESNIIHDLKYYTVKNKLALKTLDTVEDGSVIRVGKYIVRVKFNKGELHYDNASMLSTVEDYNTGTMQDVIKRPVFIDNFLHHVKLLGTM